MRDFRNLDAIRKIDPQNTLDSTDMMGRQLETAWQEVNALEFPQDYLTDRRIENIVFCGMGASVYGALVTKALMGPNLKYPAEVISDYHLPTYVDENSLVVLTSYSGNTEEVLSCGQEALTKNAKILVLTQGGSLAEFAKTHFLPAYIFDGKLNPSGVPRLGSGYTILGLMGLLSNLGIILLSKKNIEQAIEFVTTKIEEVKKAASEIAVSFENNIPIIFAAEHLSGNAQILRNQFNETSKTFSAYYLLPDLNHHLMEGLQFPQNAPLHFLVMSSKNYSPVLQTRTKLTIDVLEKNKKDVFEFKLMGKNIYEDFLETLLFGSYLTFYLALLHDQNPAVNPWVDYFKEQLKKEK